MARIAPAIGLFFLAPFIGEFLLGNIAIDAIFALPILALLYGGGALLIREVVRRTGRGWPSIALLGVAYSLVEEGLVDQMFFNPGYDGLNMLERAYIPAWGTGAYVVLATITVHAIWSICVSIALVEALTPKRSTTPWLGKTGLTVTAALYAAGAIYLGYTQYQEYRFLASPMQLIATTLVIMALIIIAFAIGRRPSQPIARAAPNPWVVGAFGFVSSTVVISVLDYGDPWVSVALWFVLVAAAVALLMRWSRYEGWGAMHRLAVAGGALLTYVWVGFPQTPVLGSQGTVDLVGNGVCAVVALLLLARAIRSVRHSP